MGRLRTHVVEHEFVIGRSVYATRSPDPRLNRLLARPYVGFRQDGAQPQCWLEPPRPTVSLIVSLDGELRAGDRALPDGWVGGLTNSCDLVEFGSTYACLDLKLTPLGAFTLLGFPLSELHGTLPALDEVFGAEGRHLSAQLRHAPDWERGFDVTEGFLLRRAAEGPQPDPAVVWAWSRLLETSGKLPVGRLAAELGCSRRHLTAKFRDQVGQPPKTLARLLRFERVLRLLEKHPARWADIVYDCGYCDQSHLNREFRELAGTTPSDFINRRIPADALNGDAVTFVQDSDHMVR